MATPIKPTPEKYCETCGTKLERKRLPNGDLECLFHFNKRKYCNQKCMAEGFKGKPKTESDNWGTNHSRSRALIPPGPCVECGKPNAMDVHHKDNNYKNNEPENLERLCRSCHNLKHSRQKYCVICGQPAKGLGFCNKHYIRFKKYGDPLAYHIPLRKKCKVCGDLAHSKELCGKHYMQAKRAGLLWVTQSEDYFPSSASV